MSFGFFGCQVTLMYGTVTWRYPGTSKTGHVIAERSLQIMNLQNTLTAFALAAGVSSLVGATEVGYPAPPLEPRNWVNNRGPISWKALKGRVILVEKWATT